MQIRPFRIGDEAAVIGLWRSCGLVVPQNDPQKDILRKLKVNPEWFLLGEREGTIVSSCLVGYEGHRGSIYYLAVHPDFRKNGYARELMAEAQRLLREVGCPKINLMVRTTNLEVIEFYESLGFSEDPVVCLGKRLEDDHAKESEALEDR